MTGSTPCRTRVNPASDALRHQPGGHLCRTCGSGTCSEIAKIDCDGYAIGGLAVGEPTEVMYDIIDAVEPYMPADKPRYLMGVGTPSNIIEGGGPGRGLLRLRHARPQRPPRQALHLAGAPSTSRTRSTSWTTGPSTRSATVRSAAASAGPTCATCLRRRRCWPCAWRCCTICISTTSWPSASATAWTPDVLSDFRREYSEKLSRRI